MDKRKKLLCIFFTVLLAALILYVGPMDGLRHGFFAEELDLESIAEEDFEEAVPLNESGYSVIFSPLKPYFAGISLHLVYPDIPEKYTGELEVSLSEADSEEILETAVVDLSKVDMKDPWYKVPLESDFQKNNVYKITLKARGYETAPCLQAVPQGYLPDETIKGNVLLSYAYSKSVFTFQTKILLLCFTVSFWLILLSFVIGKKWISKSRKTAIVLFLISVLAWNYMYNSMDNENSQFQDFSQGSEALVTGMLRSQKDTYSYRDYDEMGYGLGRYYDMMGKFSSYTDTFLTDQTWLSGYGREKDSIFVESNDYTKMVLVEGNTIQFKNGETAVIESVYDDLHHIKVDFQGDTLYSEARNGSLQDAIIFDKDGNQLPDSLLEAYVSQYGLQGKIFRMLAAFMTEDEMVPNLQLLCSLAAAVVFTAIVILIYSKYNFIFAACYFCVFWLSPWVVSFGRNLYWVEFTWFVPMAVGLFCALKLQSRICRYLCFAAMYLAVFVKCLCGYEYISVVMMGGIVFLLVDIVLYVFQKNKMLAALGIRTLLFLGFAALAGFITAIFIHASLRGEGNLLLGFKAILQQDILKRTYGADLNQFSPDFWPSMNASAWEVLCGYFHFSTEVITGIAGNLFPVFCLIPLGIFVYDYRKGKLQLQEVLLYVLSFLTTVSWFYLAKSHSAAHPHLNYVLWYFGYVQICLYMVVSRFWNSLNKRKSERQGKVKQ